MIPSANDTVCQTFNDYSFYLLTKHTHKYHKAHFYHFFNHNHCKPIPNSQFKSLYTGKNKFSNLQPTVDWLTHPTTELLSAVKLIKRLIQCIHLCAFEHY